MAKDKSGKPGKPGKQGKQGKQGVPPTGAAAGGAAVRPSVATHPRARSQVRRAKGLGGVGGFAVGAWLSASAGIPFDQVGERALALGIAGYLVAWGCSVTVWRQLVLAELRQAAERAEHSRREAADAAAAQSIPAVAPRAAG